MGKTEMVGRKTERAGLKAKRAELKRGKLVDAAKDMFRERGVAQSSIADIAVRAGIPAGGVFYHFRTKEALVDAVARDHLRTFTALLDDMEVRQADPRKRIELFLDVTDGLGEDRARLGCPVAGLVHDVLREGGDCPVDAGAVFSTVVLWLTRQFEGGGLSRRKAHDAALHMFAGVQGAFLLAFALHDPSIVSTEVESLRQWSKEVLKQ